MKVLKETTDVQTLKIIPRIYPEEVDLTIRNETTREETTFLSLPSVFNAGYLDISNVFALKEDTSYTIEVRETIANGSDVIYKDKIFCTNQEDYSILDGKYTAREQNRKYTVR